MMKFLYRADKALIDRAFQPIVDRARAKPPKRKTEPARREALHGA